MNTGLRILNTTRLMTPSDAAVIAAENGLSMEKLSPRDQADTMAYSLAMDTGRWMINGDALVFAEDGKTLLDGRKRILASAARGSTFPTLVVTGVPRERRITIGQHRKRTASVALYVGGEEAAGALAAAAVVATTIAFTNRIGKSSLPSSMVPAFVADYPGIVDALHSLHGTLTAKKTGTGLATALLFLTSIVDAQTARDFFDGIEAAFYGQPAPKAAKLFADAVIATSDRNAQLGTMARRNRALYFIQAWNAHSEGREPARLTLPKEGQVVPLSGLTPGIFDSYLPRKENTNDIDRMGAIAAYAREVEESRVTLRVITVTPEWAEQRLEMNGPATGEIVRNRKLAKPALERYTRDIAEGRWLLNGTSLKFSPEGRLVDGQHRLRACMRSGLSFETLVAESVDARAFSTLDVGVSRPFAEYLKSEGIQNQNEIQGAVRLVWQLENCGLGSGMVPTNSEMLETWEAHPGIADHASLAGRRDLKLLLNRYISMAMIYIFSKEDEAATMRFFESLADGLNFSRGDPVHALRERLIAMRSNRRGSKGERAKLLALCKTWDAWRKGRKMETLRIATDEKFPAAYGVEHALRSTVARRSARG